MALSVASPVWAAPKPPAKGDAGDPVATAGTKASAALLKVAAAEYAAGHFEKAAGLFLTCFDVDAKNMSCLFNAARAEQRSFQLDKAEAHFRQFLAVNEADETGRKRAQIHLQEVSEMRAQLKKQQAPVESAPVPPPLAPVLPTPAPTVVQRHETPSEGAWKSTAGWSSVGAGVAMVATATALFLMASSDQADLDAATGKTDGSGLISGIGRDDYVQRQNSVNTRTYVADALLAIGVVSAGAGTWLLATAPALPTVRAALAPDGGELRLAWRF